MQHLIGYFWSWQMWKWPVDPIHESDRSTGHFQHLMMLYSKHSWSCICHELWIVKQTHLTTSIQGSLSKNRSQMTPHSMKPKLEWQRPTRFYIPKVQLYLRSNHLLGRTYATTSQAMIVWQAMWLEEVLLPQFKLWNDSSTCTSESPKFQKFKCTSERPKYTSERPSGGSGADGWQTSQQSINQFNGACHVCGHKWRWLQT